MEKQYLVNFILERRLQGIGKPKYHELMVNTCITLSQLLIIVSQLEGMLPKNVHRLQR